MTTLRDFLSEGGKLTPVFSSPMCTSFRMGFYCNGIPHAIGKIFTTAEECQKAIDELLKRK